MSFEDDNKATQKNEKEDQNGTDQHKERETKENSEEPLEQESKKDRWNKQWASPEMIYDTPNVENVIPFTCFFYIRNTFMTNLRLKKALRNS